jgi:hypothetical protein
MMNLFGVDVADLIKNGKVPGVESREDDLILDPSLIFPRRTSRAKSPPFASKTTG